MADSISGLDIPRSPRRRALIVPREHGAWGILLVPLITGAAVGFLAGGSVAPALLFAVGVIALFWLRIPVESWLGTGPVRAQTSKERQLVLTAIMPLATVAMVSLSALLWQEENHELLWLGTIASVLFAAQVSLKRTGRTTRMAAQVAGALGLTLTAPGAYYLVTGRLEATAWALWLVNFLFAGNQIHFVWLRIRAARAADRSEKLTAGWSFLVGQILLAVILGLAYYFGLLPQFALVAFAPIVFRGVLWFFQQHRPLAIRRLGWTELAHAVGFGVLLTFGFSIAK